MRWDTPKSNNELNTSNDFGLPLEYSAQNRKQQEESMKKACHGATAEIIDRLTELAKLRAQGLLTEAEFLKMKEKLLAAI